MQDVALEIDVRYGGTAACLGECRRTPPLSASVPASPMFAKAVSSLPHASQATLSSSSHETPYASSHQQVKVCLRGERTECGYVSAANDGLSPAPPAHPSFGSSDGATHDEDEMLRRAVAYDIQRAKACIDPSKLSKAQCLARVAFANKHGRNSSGETAAKHFSIAVAWMDAADAAPF